MFDLGFQELIVIFIVALLVFGPKKLPELARTLGKAVRDIRQAMSGVKEQIDSEIQEVKDPLTFKNEIYKDNDFLSNQVKKNQKELSHSSDENHKTGQDTANKQESQTQGQKTG